MASVKDLDKRIEALKKEREDRKDEAEPFSTQVTNEIGQLEDQRREAHLNEEVRDKTLKQADFYETKHDDSDKRGKELGRVGDKGLIKEKEAKAEAPEKKRKDPRSSKDDPRGLSKDKRGI